MPTHPSLSRAAVFAVVALLGTRPSGLSAQATPTTGWHSTVEANASTLFGATSQTLTSLAGGLSHVGDAFTADAGFKFRYGESEDEQQIKFVSSRGWTATLSVDGTPKGRFSPFFFGRSEASLEKAIANRTSGGAGAKWTFARTGRWRVKTDQHGSLLFGIQAKR